MTKVQVSRGIIEAFTGSWMSGLATLVISGRPVHCENGATVRALDACFGDVIGPGHTVNVDAIKGKDIVYSMDEMGLVMAAFTPTEEWRDRNGDEQTPEIGQDLEIQVTEVGDEEEETESVSEGTA